MHKVKGWDPSSSTQGTPLVTSCHTEHSVFNLLSTFLLHSNICIDLNEHRCLKITRNKFTSAFPQKVEAYRESEIGLTACMRSLLASALGSERSFVKETNVTPKACGHVGYFTLSLKYSALFGGCMRHINLSRRNCWKFLSSMKAKLNVPWSGLKQFSVTNIKCILFCIQEIHSNIRTIIQKRK